MHHVKKGVAKKTLMIYFVCCSISGDTKQPNALSYQESNNNFTWIIVGTIFGILVVTIVIAIWLWTRRRKKLFAK